MTADVPHAPPTARWPAADSRWRRWPAALWERRWARWLVGLAAAGLVALTILIFVITRGLPSADTLLTYEPPLPSTVRSIGGEPVGLFARDRRIELAYEEYPPVLIQAFLAAEDRTFFEHGGLDYAGIASAVLTNLRSDGRPVGASTITQQVAKNLLLTNEVSYVRKLKEAVLAKRIEATLTKPQILELYLNSIALGRQSFGVEAAAQAYFGKGVTELSLSQAAFLAILPKAPEVYGRARNADAALKRRDFVLAEMARNDFVTPAAAAAAQAEPLGLIDSRPLSYPPIAGYFMEEIRRQLIDRFGENASDGKGPHSVYGGGLWVRSSLNPTYQIEAEKALRRSLDRYGGRSFDKPMATIDPGEGWVGRLRGSGGGTNVPGWVAGVILSKGGASARVGLPDGSTGTLPASAAALPVRGRGGTAFGALSAGDVVLLSRDGADWRLRALPNLSGALVVEDPHTGQVLAMQGGYDQRTQSFNRATQAERQPGSTIKPFVYATALDNGMTPASQIVDGPFCVYQGGNLGQKCFKNFGGRNAGAQTMRWGLEQSRNLMTVRAASQAGMENVTKTISRMGIGDYQPYLSVALGAGETTVARMTNAFSMLANNGRQLTPTLYDFVQDRHGKVIPGTRADTRPCPRCNAPDWDGQPMPRLPVRGQQLLDAVTAYQVVHMLEGVVTRGTAQRLASLDRPLFGKTGTTNGPKEVWFVGGTPDVVAGVYLGYDQPRVMGGAQGGSMAAPVVKAFLEATQADAPKTPFRISEGTRMVRIDRRSGRRVFSAWPDDSPKAAVIWEAFKPETEPTRTIRKEEIERAEAIATRATAPTRRRAPAKAKAAPAADKPRSRDSEFLENQGGIY